MRPSKAALRLLADMNISPRTVQALQALGWDIIRVSEVLPVTAADEEILEFAREGARAVITQDLDFSALLALSGYDRPSLITVRMSVSDPEAITSRLANLLPHIEDLAAQGAAITVEDLNVRIRGLPIIP